jgi:hypothetical protein
LYLRAAKLQALVLAMAPALVLCLPAHAQQEQASPAHMEALTSYFSGLWAGSGQFSNGKAIEADVEFRPELGQQWLSYRHTDRAPNRYQALGLWGWNNNSGKLEMSVADNFGGLRQFSAPGWDGHELVFSRSNAAGSSLTAERFVFTRETDNSFKMRYEVSKDGLEWRLGDWLLFQRR